VPNKKEKAKPESNSLFDESMQRAYSKVSQEMPNVKKVKVSPRESSFLSRFMMPRGATAVTNPFTGNITYNREPMQGYTPDELEQVMAHELKHVEQTQNTPWWKTASEIFQMPFEEEYYKRPREMEAYQHERDRATRKKTSNYVDPVHGTRDIMLRPEIGPSSNVQKKMLGR